MSKVLCASRKIERRSNVIQRLFKRSCVIAKAFLSPQEKRNARVSGGILVPTSRKSSTISFVVGMSANFSIKHPRVVFTNSITSWLQILKFTRWSTTKRVDSLSKKKNKNEWWTCVTFRKLVIFFPCYWSLVIDYVHLEAERRCRYTDAPVCYTFSLPSISLTIFTSCIYS